MTARLGMELIGSKYQLLEQIGRGGMAEVFLARQAHAGGVETFVIVKRMLPQSPDEAEAQRKFLQEAEIATLLQHPGIACAREVGFHDNRLFIVMELVRGAPLAQLLRKARAEARGALTPKRVAYIGARVAEALEYAHRLTDGDVVRGIVHRDISPRNIIISFSGEVKLIDFGLARFLGRTLKSHNLLNGTLGYFSPEQVRGERVDGRTDIFSLGVVLWEALTGLPLFTAETELETLRNTLELPVARPSTFGPVPAGLEAAVMRCLERDPAARFATAADLLTALEHEAFADGPFLPGDLGAVMKLALPEVDALWKQRLRSAAELATPVSTGTSRTEQGQAPSTALMWRRRDLLVAGGTAAVALLAITMASRPRRPPIQAANVTSASAGPQEPECAAGDVVVDFEDGRGKNVRAPDWGPSRFQVIDDRSRGRIALSMETLSPSRCGSRKALRLLVLQPFTDWGAGVQVYAAGRPDDPAVDRSRYQGVRFAARAETPMKLRVRVMTQQTLSKRYCAPKCSDHFLGTVQLGNAWRTYSVPFSSLKQAGWGTRFASVDVAHVVGLQLDATAHIPFDVWIDDLAFY